MAMFSAFMKLCIPKWYLVLNYHAGYKNILRSIIFAFCYFVFFFCQLYIKKLMERLFSSLGACVHGSHYEICGFHTNVRWGNAAGVLEY